MTDIKTRTSFLRRLPFACWPVFFLVGIAWIPYLLTLSHDLSFGDEGLVAQSEGTGV